MYPVKLKRFFSLLIMVTFLVCVSAATFASDSDPAQEEEGRGDTFGDEEEGRGDLFGDEGESSPFFTFPIGISKADALEVGAKATEDANVMHYNSTWLGYEWDVVLMFLKNKLGTLALQTTLDHRTLVSVLNTLDEDGYKPWNITRADGKNVELFSLKAQGKNDEELVEVFQEQIESFLEGDGDKFSVLLCLDEVLDAFADVTKNNGDGDALIKKEEDSVIYAVTLDKKAETMIILMSTFGTMNAK
jgi:hypothetical protein